jgi:hypothetical protein
VPGLGGLSSAFLQNSAVTFRPTVGKVAVVEYARWLVELCSLHQYKNWGLVAERGVRVEQPICSNHRGYIPLGYDARRCVLHCATY